MTCDAAGARCEIDPDFRIYRSLPPAQLVPTISGTTGPGGLRVVCAESRSEVEALLPQLGSSAEGENLLLIGRGAIADAATRLSRCDDPITLTAQGFSVGGVTYEASDHAVLHTMHDPERPGRFITVFHANGDPGWSRLRLIRFYGRDTTIVWQGEKIIQRRIHEPDRSLPVRVK